MLVSVTCDLCGASACLTLHDRDRDGRDVQTVACAACGLVFQNPRPSSETLAELYLSGAFSVQARGQAQPGPEKVARSERMAGQRFNRLRRFAPALLTGPSLEIGAGIGSFSARLKQMGYAATALEPDPGFAEFGEHRYGIPFTRDLYEKTALLPDRYTLMALFHVLEHMESPKAFVARAATELKHGGLLYVEVPCIERPKGGNLTGFFWQAHLFTFSKNTLAALLLQGGLRPVAKGYDGNSLWVIAQKPGVTEAPLAGNLPPLPIDDPEALKRGLLRKQRDYRLRQSLPPLKFVYARWEKHVRKYADDPGLLVERGTHKLAKLIGRKPSAA